MLKDTNRSVKLGFFVLVGTIFLIIAMYLIGAKQSLFTDTFKIQVNFHNVDGLMPGNNVRFAGIDVGTVDDVKIINDSSVNVTLRIENKFKSYIKKNALVSIGTDGLMGNKLVNINSAQTPGESIEENDVLVSIRPIETDAMLRTLNQTNEDVSTIARNLRIITERVNNSNTLWSLLTDTTVAENVKNAIVSIRITGERTAEVAGDLKHISSAIRAGKGSMGALLTDTALSHQLKQTIVKIQLVSDSLAYITGDLKYVTGKIKKGEGAVGTIIMDTAFVSNLNQTVINLRKGSKSLEQNMEALKSSFLLKRYFRKQKKIQQTE
ncbi:MAG: MCE family protein [Bacteroidetes bacterium]|nr:MCE family protein [Bacteroidota bacterium]